MSDFPTFDAGWRKDLRQRLALRGDESTLRARLAVAEQVSEERGGVYVVAVLPHRERAGVWRVLLGRGEAVVVTQTP